MRTRNCVIIAPEGNPVNQFRQALSNSYTFETASWLKKFPEESEMLRTLRLVAPDLIVIDFADMPKALNTVSIIRHNSPNTEIMALCEENITVLSTLLRAGVSEYITPASSFEDIIETLKAQLEKLSARPEGASRSGGDIITFLPAKPGSGASTIAANVAFAASKMPDKRTLLSDFDRNSGVLSFLFKLRAEHTLRDAMTSIENLEPEVWARIRSQVGELDILPADLDAAANTVESGRTSALLQFFRRAYDLTIVDLAGQVDSTSIDALLESKRIYIVCTQELACQHLMIRKVERLRRSGLDKQMRLIVNRFLPKHVMTPDRISELVGLPVEMTIANNYEAANCSMENGSLVPLNTNLGSSYKKLAEIILDNRIVIPKTKPSFLEFFSQPFARSASESAAR